MSRRRLASLLVALMLPLAVAAGASPVHAEAVAPSGATRWAERDRYTTGAVVVHSAFPTAETVYVASGITFPDALAGGAVAGRDGVPILLTDPAALPAATETALTLLKPSRIVILGGTGAVSAQVEEHLRLLAATVERVAGADRYAVAAALSAASYPVGAPAYIASGENFPDALSGAPVAARLGAPILLTRQGSLPKETLAELARLNPSSITVLGGAGAVSDAVLTELRGQTSGAVNRVGGVDRYAVSAALAGPASQGADTVFVASGAGFADALSGTPAATVAGAPILLTGRDSLPAPVKAWLAEARPSRIVVLGGPGVVSDAVFGELHGFTGSTSPLPATSPWGGTERASEQDGFDSSQSLAAVDRAGEGLVVWTRAAHAYPYPQVVQARRRSLTGSWGPITSLSPTNELAGSPQVAVRDDGGGLVVWRGGVGEYEYRIRARTVSLAGALGPVLSIANEGDHKPMEPSLAMNPDGDAIVAWAEYLPDGSSIGVARRISRTGVLGPVQELHEGYRAAVAPSVAIDDEGDAIVVWNNDNTVQARTVSAAGVVGPLLLLTSPDVSPIDHHYRARVTMDADGDAVAMWEQWVAADTSYRLVARRVTRDGSLGTLHELAVTTEHDTFFTSFDLASDPTGVVMLVWARGRSDYVFARRLSPAGVLGPRDLVAIDAQFVRVAVDGQGQGVLALSDADQVGPAAPCRLRRYSSGGTWGSQQVLIGCHGSATPAVGPAGAGLVTFQGNFNFLDRSVGVSASP